VILLNPLRAALYAEAARCLREATTLDRECGGQETMMTCLLRFRAACCTLGATMLPPWRP
jgi:hypothetical protein